MIKENKMKFVSYILASVLLGAILGMIAPKNCYALTNNEKNVTPKTEKASFNDVVELSKIVETINLINEVWVGDKNVDKEKLYKAALSG